MALVLAFVLLLPAIAYAAPTTAQNGQVLDSLTVPKLNVPVPGLVFSDVPVSQKCPQSAQGCLMIPLLAQYISAFFNIILGVGLVATALMIVYGGFLYVLGSTGMQVSEAKKKITDALVGLAILIGAYAILSNINPTTLNMGSIQIPIIKRADPLSFEHVADNKAGMAATSKCDLSGRVRDFKQYESPWGLKPFGDKELCTEQQRTQKVDSVDKSGNKISRPVSDSQDAPCCLGYASAACGVTSLADVLASYGESVTPETLGNIYIKAGLRTCNYGGSSPRAALGAWLKATNRSDYSIDNSITFNSRASLDDTLASGHPIIFLCNNCKVCHDKDVCKTYPGHWMVLTGKIDTTKYSIADPGGIERYIPTDQLTTNVGDLVYIRRKDGQPTNSCK